jgi:SAM-dependent methyltransferase
MDKHEQELKGQDCLARWLPDRLDRLERFWEEYRFLSRLQLLASDKKMLDVGCGFATGLHLFPMARRRVGIDPLADEFKKIYHYPDGIEVVRCSGEDMPFEDGSFDLVMCTNVLDHTTDPEQVIDEVARVLADDGHFFLMVEVYDGNVQRDMAHPHSFQRCEVLRLMRKFWPLWLETGAWKPGVIEYLEFRLPEAKHTIITGLWEKLKDAT